MLDTVTSNRAGGLGAAGVNPVPCHQSCLCNVVSENIFQHSNPFMIQNQLGWHPRRVLTRKKSAIYINSSKLRTRDVNGVTVNLSPGTTGQLH